MVLILKNVICREIFAPHLIYLQFSIIPLLYLAEKEALISGNFYDFLKITNGVGYLCPLRDILELFFVFMKASEPSALLFISKSGTEI